MEKRGKTAGIHQSRVRVDPFGWQTVGEARSEVKSHSRFPFVFNFVLEVMLIGWGTVPTGFKGDYLIRQTRGLWSVSRSPTARITQGGLRCDGLGSVVSICCQG